ncbi:PREDICTED: uncharacterized protein LOC108359313 [Rhagoletis zephyria]|uniref:uncharacterized protein LOC108359313 n=1 Tax=Rhagoletis zephyria TaxID=28612 RepID=UPI000811A582|nr:PREDICTED: uncharacterized protein LOC108359313 [Rhagoletis zephyria]XP_017466617.1 PREDICTED: uncharacterized protein LOC108359313 [Rhagoletis zephyria]
MWCNFEQSPVEEDTISNAFSSRGIFRIQSGEEVKEYPQVHASLQNQKVVISVDKSLILLEDELVAKCSSLSFNAHIDAVAISNSGNLILVGLRDGEIHGIFIKGLPLFNVTVNAEDVHVTGRTFAGIQQLGQCFHISCTNGSVYQLGEINEALLEANQNVSLNENETIAFDESMLGPVPIEKLISGGRGLNDAESTVLIPQIPLEAFEQPVPLFIAGAHNSVFCRERTNDLVKITLPEHYRGVKRIFNLDNYM